jgi:hypothetical protein
MELKWYEYDQNNSGGFFISNDSVAHTVLIQAANNRIADMVAQDTAGIYFDGCHDGRDCYCCGDRWCDSSEVDELVTYGWSSSYDRTETTHDTIEEYAQALADDEMSADVGENACILYYFDGTKRIFTKQKGK